MAVGKDGRYYGEAPLKGEAKKIFEARAYETQKAYDERPKSKKVEDVKSDDKSVVEQPAPAKIVVTGPVDKK